MATIKFKNAKGVERGYEEGFGGIDLGRAQVSSDRCRELSNLDISADGSLTTRPGYIKKLTLPGILRAVFTTGKSFYTLAGNTLSLTDSDTGSTSALGQVGTSSGDADIFCFGGEIYVHDSQKLYRYGAGVLAEAEGYAPLYGRDWHPTRRGYVNEELNIVSNRMRVSFVTVSNLQTYDVARKIESVDRITLNGIERDPEDLGMTFAGSVITLANVYNLSSGLPIEFWVTLAESERKRSIIAIPSKGFVFSNSGGERLCICSPGISSLLICSRPVSAIDLYESRRSDPDSISLYLPISSVTVAGNGAYPITAISSHFERALLFTDANTWCVDYEGEESSISRIRPSIFILNSAIGGEKICGDPHYENDPITYYRGRLFRWHSQSGVRDECSAELISDEVAELIPEDSEHVSMLSLPHKGLIFLADADDPEGGMLVYSTLRRAWSAYKDIYAEKLFIYGSSPAFSRGNGVYVLTEDAEKDSEGGESFAVKSKLVTHFTDFGCPERRKRSVHAILDLGKCASATVTLTTEEGESKSFDIVGGGVVTERLSMPRFRSLSLTLEAVGGLRLNNLILSAK